MLLGGTSGGDHVAMENGGAVGIQLAIGAGDGVFASVSESLVLYTGMTRSARLGVANRTDDAAALVTGANVGYALSMARRQIHACPMIGFSLQSGPNVTARTVSVGGSVGRSLHASPALALVPFVGAAYMRTATTPDGAEDASSVTEQYAAINFGVGFVHRRLTVRPTVSLPVGLEGGKATRGVEVALSVGPRPR